MASTLYKSYATGNKIARIDRLMSSKTHGYYGYILLSL